jgi:hypothetical protein
LIQIVSLTFLLQIINLIFRENKDCNVYHQCMADIDVKLQCPERLVFNETLKRCDWPESTNCKSGNLLVDSDDRHGFCADKVN